MKNLLFAVTMVSMLCSCGGGGDAGTPSQPVAAPTVNATGTWSGPYTSSVLGSKTASLNIVQSNTVITGNYSNTAGGLGSVTGTVSGNTATFRITVTTLGCSGGFDGTGIINESATPATMAFTYNGSTNAACGGVESGTGNLTKQ